MPSFDRPRGSDGVGECLRADWDLSEKQQGAGPGFPEELEALYRQVRALAPAVAASLVDSDPPGEPHLRLTYRHRGGQVIFDAEARLYRRRVTREVVGRPEQAMAAALGLVREMGAPNTT